MDEQKQTWRSSRLTRIRVWPGLLVVLGVAVVALMLWLRSGNEGDHGASTVALTEGQRAPDFSLPDVTGQPISLSDFRGKPALLYFSMGSG